MTAEGRDHRQVPLGSTVFLYCLAGTSTALASCGHTHTVQPAERRAANQVEEPDDAKTFTSRHPAPPSGRSDRGTTAVELATSPAALLKPGAVRTIQGRLARSGDLEGEPTGSLDSKTRAALERFQRAHDLAATGIPDDATVSKLGLKPGEVFKTENDQTR